LARSDFISPDNLFPQAFDCLAPTIATSEYLADASVRLMVDFFQGKGLAVLKQEDQREEWYQDWIDYQSDHGLYASLLSPAKYSSRGSRFDLRRLTRFLEVFAYFSPAHAYSLHVSFLGLFPILQSDNEPLKQEAVKRLEAGGLFAFAVSEREHGSDLLATEFTLQEAESGELRATGSKYYIGNANVAELVSVLAKKAGPATESPTRRAPFVFFALRPGEMQKVESPRKIRTLGIRTAFVGEFAVVDQPVPTADVICEGRHAWEAMFGAIDFGRLFLGFGSIGICERAFAEAIGHLRRRLLYGKSVTELPHIRSAVTAAFSRLVGMKLYACRALDYLQAAGPNERRYLLFNAVQKARVSTEGVKVLELLSECIGAKGFEADTFFETALREAPMIPGLEGSTHINFRLTAQFVDNYFANSANPPAAPESVTLSSKAPAENPYWLGRHDRRTRTVAFDSCLAAYEPLRAVPNVRIFVRQAMAIRGWVVGDAKPADLVGDAALSVALGKSFSIIVYAQLIAENCVAAGVAHSTVAAIFHELIQDLSAEALQLMALFAVGIAARRVIRKAVRVPRTSAADVESVYDFVCARYE
jgi:acyl-CoA dehydrogenase